MDLTEPGSGLSGSLTVPILRALDGRSQPATAAQITRTTEMGTHAGIRRALERLSAHGLCRQEEVGGRTVYSLNYDHVLYQAVRTALDAHRTLVKRIRQDIRMWDPAPKSAMLFGSAARGDGDIESDIDLLLVRPPMTSAMKERIWAPGVHELRRSVRSWAGNPLQVFDWPVSTLQRRARNQRGLVREIERDGLRLTGSPLSTLLQSEVRV
jgi:DNA-binding transcriptional ArsR family regulator